MMARLLEAVRPEARLVLVGDPDQLASVEAGAVLGDLARAAGGPSPRSTPRSPRWACRPAVVNGVVTARRTSGASAARSPRSPGRPGGRRRRRAGAAARGRADDLDGWTRPTRSPRCRPTSLAAGSALAAAAAAGRAGARWPRWSGTGCCARTGAARSASSAGAAEIERWLAADPERARTPGIVGPAAARHGQRLRHRAVQRRHRRRRHAPRTARGSRSPAAAHRRSTPRLGWATPQTCT